MVGETRFSKPCWSPHIYACVRVSAYPLNRLSPKPPPRPQIVANLLVGFGIFALTFMGVLALPNLVHYNDITPFVDMQLGAIISILGGVLVMICALFGCLGAVRRDRFLILLYIAFLAAICLIVLIGASLVQSYASAAASGTLPEAHDVSNLVTGSYDTCCYNVTAAPACGPKPALYTCYFEKVSGVGGYGGGGSGSGGGSGVVVVVVVVCGRAQR